MSYTRPPYDAADASWTASGPYTRPAYDAADATWGVTTLRVVARSPGPWAPSTAVAQIPAAITARSPGPYAAALAKLALYPVATARSAGPWASDAAVLFADIPITIAARSAGPWHPSASLLTLPRCATARSAGPWTHAAARLRTLARTAARSTAPAALSPGDPLATRLVAPAALSLAVRLALPAALTAPMRARHAAPADLLTQAPLRLHHTAVWAAGAGLVRILDPAPRVTHAIAGTVSPLAITLSADLGSPFWQAQIELAPEEYSMLAIDDDLTVTIGADQWALVIDGLRRTRPDGYLVTALSPLARLGAPRAQPQTLGAVSLAHATCERLLGLPIAWACVDWPLPASAAQLTGTPVALARQIVAAVGAVLESNPDGSLIARPLEPISPPDAAGPVSATITDEVLYAHDETAGAAAIANRFTITSGSAGSAAPTIKIDVIDDPLDPHHRTVLAYPWPWRPIDLAHTGDAAVTIGPRADTTTDHAETLVIVAGTTTTTYPIRTIGTATYRYADLGAIQHDGANITTATGAESQIDLTYQARAWRWEITHPRAESIQFLALEA